MAKWELVKGRKGVIMIFVPDGQITHLLDGSIGADMGKVLLEATERQNTQCHSHTRSCDTATRRI